MDEDCLFLNVWTPAADDARRPVMVWIHGGAFRGGSGSTPVFDGSAFARDGVVLVTLNYRLHALGFLYLDELFDGATGTGNLGILDQIAALEWVRDNIAVFGGDPDNVTIFGQSAGAMCVTSLLATPAADGLYRRAIAQSGAGHHNLGASAARRVGERVLELLDVRPGEWLALQAVPAARIVAAAEEVAARAGRKLLGDDRLLKMAFQPVVDTTTRTARPIEQVAAGNVPPVELIVGTCRNEWRLFMFGLPGFAPEPNVAPYFEHAEFTVDEALHRYSTAHPGASQGQLLAAIEGDQMFTMPAVRLAEAHAAHATTWMYRFSWPTPVLDGALGACHGLELPFVFETMDRAKVFVGDDPPVDLARDLHTAWIRFATVGDPNGDGLPAWPRYELDRRRVMDFGAVRTVIDDPHVEQRHIWESLI
jgi:para-nitrobenzyl esterase